MSVRSKLVNLGLLLAAVTVTLLALEGVARALYVPTSAVIDNFRLTRSGYYQLDPKLGWLPSPNVSGQHPYNGTMVPFHTNSRGLRGKEHAIQKPAGKTRVMVLGDSYTWGFRVRDEEVFPAVLESLLPPIEVINLGVTAFTTDQELQYYQHEGVQYHPEIVLLAFCLNDFADADGRAVQRMQARARDTTARATGLTESASIGWFQRIKQRSVFLGWVRDRINTNRWLVRVLARSGLRGPLTGPEGLDVTLLPALKETPSSLRPLLDLTYRKVLELRQTVEASGSRFIIVLVPSPLNVDDHAFRQSIATSQFEYDAFDLDKPYRMMEGFAKDNQIEMVNPLTAFRRMNSPDEPLYLFRDMHFSPKGHQLFAQEIARYLAGPSGGRRSR